MKKKSTPKPAAIYALPGHQENALRFEKCLPVVDLVNFGRDAGFTVDELARFVHIPPRTYARRVAARARLSQPEGERAARVMRLYDQAKDFFRHPRKHPVVAQHSAACPFGSHPAGLCPHRAGRA
jgi:uncharacterized protein (DUF2384 family)